MSTLQPLGIYSHTQRLGYLTLSEARALAERMAYGERTVAVAVAEPEPEALEAADIADADGLTVGVLCEGYAAFMTDSGRSSAPVVERYFQRFVYDHPIAKRPAAAATTQEFVQLLREVMSNSTNYNGTKVRSFLCSAFNHAMAAETDPALKRLAGAEELRSNPIDKIPSMSRHKGVGERALNEQEFALFWRRLQGNTARLQSVVVARAVRLTILLAGQRGEQLLRVRVSDVDLKKGSILLHDGKGNRAVSRQHLLPLLPLARNEIEWLLQHAASVGSDLLFPSSDPAKPPRQTMMSSLVHDIAAEMLKDGEITSGFCFADLRRTAETRMAGLRISEEIRKQIQSHGLSGIVMRHYNRYEYFEEKLEALTTWEKFIADATKRTQG